MISPQLRRDWPRNAALITTMGVLLFSVLTVILVDLVGESNGEGGLGAEDQAVPAASPIEDQRSGVNGDQTGTAEARDTAPSAASEAGHAPVPWPSESARATAPDTEARTPNLADDPPPLSLSPGRTTGPQNTAGSEAAEDSSAEDGKLESGAPEEAGELRSGAEGRASQEASPLLPGLSLQRDHDAGFQFQLPEGWRSARVEAPPVPGTPHADYDLIYESPDGAQRIAFSVWDAAERASFSSWVMSVAGGMQPLGEGFPTNAIIADIPALVVGHPESPTTPVRYAAFLEREGRYLRLSWSARHGNMEATDFLRVLASFRWPVQDGAAHSSTELSNQAPRLDLPDGLYFPSESIFPSTDR